MSRRRAWILVAACAAVVTLPGGRAFAHPTATAETYHWVQAPSGIAPGPPAEGRRAEITPELLAPGVASVWTPDAQAVVTLSAHDIDSPAVLTITPVDPTSLPPLEAQLSNGNAYRVEITTDGWQPETVELLLATPYPATTAFRLGPDGWTDLHAVAGPDGRVAAPASRGGTFLAGTRSTDGHDSWWASFSHDPMRPWLAGAAAMLAGLAAARRARARSARRRASRAA